MCDIPVVVALALVVAPLAVAVCVYVSVCARRRLCAYMCVWVGGVTLTLKPNRKLLPPTPYTFTVIKT